ncbi:uncharacterized protein LOC141850629 [Brevipalpus obovatus]|uniref:uncharacterized protein LOC141850629 n=1 Tax=Brevipalpus obovatus TaxID=246614 RepID=UPI003D9E62FE
MYVTIILIIPLLIFLYIHMKKSRQELKHLPSPFCLPIIGHLHLMRKNSKEPWKAFDELAKKFGEIYKLQLGQCSYVVIAGVEAAKEALIKNGNSCLNRPLMTTYDLVVKGQQYSIHFADWSDMHQDIRKHLIIHTLSGNSTKSGQLQSISEKGISKLIKSEKRKYSNLHVDQLLSIFGEIMLDYICGTNYLDSESKQSSYPITNIFMEGHDKLKDAHILDVFPVLRYFKFFFPSIGKLSKSHDDIIDLLEKEAGLGNLREKLRINSSNNQIFNEYLNFSEIIIKKHLENPSNLPWRNCIFMIGGLLLNLVPISYLTMVCLGYLSLNKKFQEQIYQEVRGIMAGGGDEIVPMKEARKLVHVEASLMESVRLTSPFYLPRRTNQDITVKGYHIPANTGLIINNYTLDHSPLRWKSPECFMPERFIVTGDEDGLAATRIKKPSDHYPYGLGRRACPGYGLFENLASLMIANIVYRYEVSCDMGEEEMSKHGLGNYGLFDGRNFFSLKLNRRL